MKRAFTMIELIFVIVILGILAAVAIPRLAATRDDAEMSKAAANLSTLIKDFSSYYTSQGNFSDKVSDMTNVILVDISGNVIDSTKDAMFLQVKKGICFRFQLGKGVIGNQYQMGYTSDVTTDADAIQINKFPAGSNTKICEELYKLPAIKSIFVAKDYDDVIRIDVGGSHVVYDIFEND